MSETNPSFTYSNFADAMLDIESLEEVSRIGLLIESLYMDGAISHELYNDLDQIVLDNYSELWYIEVEHDNEKSGDEDVKHV